MYRNGKERMGVMAAKKSKEQDAAETISNEKANLLNRRQKALQPSKVQPVHQLWQGDLRCGEMRQDV